MTGRSVDLIHAVRRFADEVRLQGQMRRAYDSVYWCPDFMAHIGQKNILNEKLASLDSKPLDLMFQKLDAQGLV